MLGDAAVSVCGVDKKTQYPAPRVPSAVESAKPAVHGTAAGPSLVGGLEPKNGGPTRGGSGRNQMEGHLAVAE